MKKVKKTVKNNFKRFTIWTHIDTGVQQIVEAEDEDKAIESAEDNIDLNPDFFEQVINNIQIGDSDIISVKKSVVKRKK